MSSTPAKCLPAHRNNSVVECISESLRALPTGALFSVRVVYTSDHPVDSLTPRRRHCHFSAENTLSRRILVFVLQNGCLAAGLEAHEFTALRIEAQSAQPPRTHVAVDCCIEKLDTSGELACRMPLARAMVAGYLRSLHRYSAALDIPVVGVHLFARAQPEYLFAKSQQNPRKRILNDLELVKWWQSTLQFALEYASRCEGSNWGAKLACNQDGLLGVRPAPVATCIVPGSTMQEYPWFLGTDSMGDGQYKTTDTAQANTSFLNVPSVNDTVDTPTSSKRGSSAQSTVWRWGMPYPHNARAHDCVLQFPDDPITRLLSEAHSSMWSVSTLLDMLSVSEECGSGHRTAYFSASLPLFSDAKNTEEVGDANNTAGQGHLSFEEYDQILVALFDLEMDFSGKDCALSSSIRLMDFLDARFTIPSVSVETTGPVLARGSSRCEEGASQPPKVNDITTAVRKKRKVVAS